MAALHGETRCPTKTGLPRCPFGIQFALLWGLCWRLYSKPTMKSDQDKRATRFDMLQAQAHFSSPATAAETQPHNLTKHPNNTQSSLKRQKGPVAQQDRARKILRGTPKPLELPTIVNSGGLAQSPLVRNCSPWEVYQPIFTCDLAGTVSISEHRRRGSKVVAVRSSSRTDGEELLHKYTRFDHINIISASECFSDNGVNHFIVEDLPISLEHLVASDAYPTEVQLASILKQVSSCYYFLQRTTSLMRERSWTDCLI